VTTLRVEEARHVKLKPLGPNHEDLVLYLNNSQNNLPYVSQGEHGVGESPADLFWQHGHSAVRIIWEVQMRYKYCERAHFF
jgi:hypothetical protein